jgi:acyl-coenzyme A synthetase/AMP-(fatty) acid ligase
MEQQVGLITPLMARGFIGYARQQGLLFPNIRALIVLGQPLFAEEKRAVVEKITPRLYDVYGGVGCGIISTLSAADMITLGGSVGRPAPSTEVEIVDVQGNRLPPGEIGHVRCRGPGISSRFYDPRDGASGTEGFGDGRYYPGSQRPPPP